MQNDMRDRLIELLKMSDCLDTMYYAKWEEAADELIAKGVILPLVKVGDSVYTVETYCNPDPYDDEKDIVQPWHCYNYCGRNDCSFKELRVKETKVQTVNYALKIESCIGETIFLTREEAENKLKEIQK